eukprot:11300323-Alexandrium_andersonii.AAC.1
MASALRVLGWTTRSLRSPSRAGWWPPGSSKATSSWLHVLRPTGAGVPGFWASRPTGGSPQGCGNCSRLGVPSCDELRPRFREALTFSSSAALRARI